MQQKDSEMKDKLKTVKWKTNPKTIDIPFPKTIDIPFKCWSTTYLIKIFAYWGTTVHSRLHPMTKEEIGLCFIQQYRGNNENGHPNIYWLL